MKRSTTMLFPSHLKPRSPATDVKNFRKNAQGIAAGAGPYRAEQGERFGSRVSRLRGTGVGHFFHFWNSDSINEPIQVIHFQIVSQSLLVDFFCPRNHEFVSTDTIVCVLSGWIIRVQTYSAADSGGAIVSKTRAP